MNTAVLLVVFGAAVLSAQAQEQPGLFNPACQEHLQSLAIVMSGNADCTSFNQRIVQSQACVQNAIALNMDIERQEAECASQCPTEGENTRCNEVLVPVFEKLRDDRCYCGQPESDVNPGVASNGALDRFFCTNQRPIGVDLYEMCENPPATGGPANNVPMVPAYGGPTQCDGAEQTLLEAMSESEACEAMQESAAMASRGEQCPSQEMVQACIEDVAPLVSSAQQSFCSNKCNTIDLVEQALLSFLDRQDAQAPAPSPMPPTYGGYGTALPIYAPAYTAPSNGQLADTNVCKLFMTTMVQFYLCPPSDGSQINTDFFPTDDPTSAGFAPMLLSAGLAAVPLLATALLV